MEEKDKEAVKAVLESVLGGQTYTQQKTQSWSEEISKQIESVLEKKGKAAVHLVIMQNGDFGFKTYASTVCDEKKDEVFSHKFEVTSQAF